MTAACPGQLVFSGSIDVIKSLLFDRRDRQLLATINEIIDHGPSNSVEQQALRMSLNPHGIQNLTNSHEVRMALATLNLLERLDKQEGAKERITALDTLYKEVLNSAQTTFRFNTARVLIQIMKSIVRSRKNEDKQLALIHDFQKVAAGNPRIVRQFLKRYYLLEMPEDWNQKTLDDHVHDSSTMGRKTPTYLLLDAWIKGIRRLTVVYYNYLDAAVISELEQAAAILGISVRVGLKFRAVFDGRSIEFLWSPRGFVGQDNLVRFISTKKMQDFARMGKESDAWISRQVFATLKSFNKTQSEKFGKAFSIDPPKLDVDAFRMFLASGHASLIRLAEYAWQTVLPALARRAGMLRQELAQADPERQQVIAEELERLDDFTAQTMYENWIASDNHPDVPSVSKPADDDRPELLRMPLEEMVGMVRAMRDDYRLTLLLGGLTARDVLEILWRSKGSVTHLELFSMKEWRSGGLKHLPEINALQSAINHQNVLQLKHIILDMLSEPQTQASPAHKAALEEILSNIPVLQGFYAKKGLGTHLGTDSTTYLGSRYGMGLAVLETLPVGAQKEIGSNLRQRPFRLPIFVNLAYQERMQLPKHSNPLVAWVRRTFGLNGLGAEKSRGWNASYAKANYTQSDGNVITLGGQISPAKNGFMPSQETKPKSEQPLQVRSYLSTPVTNLLKVLIGFVPAFCTFMVTQQWWLLAWFGALIWFGITGVRNIIQMLIAGGGFHKGMLMSWKTLINWNRVCDSLMYTGMSVILLEGITRNLLLGHMLGLTVDKAPLLVFSIIALANGLYISSHNIFRGFPKTAVVGNLFRSILAIPVAMVYNFVLGILIPLLLGMPAEVVLVPAAAIVSKFASDTVAGVIESTADRRNNYRLRKQDYSTSLRSLFACFSDIELAYPKREVLALISQPREFLGLLSREHKDLEIEAIAISLDLMYMWYYQPCAQQTLATQLKSMTPEERHVFVVFQGVLSDHKEVSRIFLDGLLGEDFSKALAFYLDNYKDYLQSLNQLCAKIESGAVLATRSVMKLPRPLLSKPEDSTEN